MKKKGARILVMDDELEMVRLLSRTLVESKHFLGITDELTVTRLDQVAATFPSYLAAL